MDNCPFNNGLMSKQLELVFGRVGMWTSWSYGWLMDELDGWTSWSVSELARLEKMQNFPGII